MQINTDLSSFLSVAGRREEAISLAMELLVAPACPHLTFGAQRGEGRVEVVLSAVSGPQRKGTEEKEELCGQVAPPFSQLSLLGSGCRKT